MRERICNIRAALAVFAYTIAPTPRALQRMHDAWAKLAVARVIGESRSA